MRKVLLLLITSVALAGCGSDPPSSSPAEATASPGEELDRVRIRFEGGTVDAEVARTPAQWQRGLMWRTDLGRDEGMLFVFPALRSGGFWMKDTLIPLQIAYLSSSATGRYEVVAIMDMEPCEADPCPIYDPGTSYDGALETNAGWFGRAGVSVGDEAVVENSL